MDQGISSLDLVGPGTYFSDSGSTFTQNTVHIKCFSQEIYDLHYKPEYITSRPHLTLYDGNSRDFACKLLTSIEKLDWGIRIFLPKTFNRAKQVYEYPKLSEIVVTKKKRTRKKNLVSPNSEELFLAIFKELFSAELLSSFTDEERISRVINVYNFMTTTLFDSNDTSHRSDIRAERININELYKSEVLLKLPRPKDNPKEAKQLKLFEDYQTKTINSKSQSERNQFGQFPTPPELALEIAEFVHNLIPKDQNINFCDPSIGTGTFFYALDKVFKSSRINTAIGIEIDEKIATLTADLWSSKGLTVYKGDFFSQAINITGINVILCNPPYIRHHYLPTLVKYDLQKKVYDFFGYKLSGQASLYAYFILLSHSLLEQGGIATWLIPSEFLDIKYGTTLRNYLLEHVTTLRIHTYDAEEIKFDGVLVTSCVLIVKKEIPPSNHKIAFGFGGSLESPRDLKNLSIVDLSKRDKWNLTALCSEPISQQKFSLKDIFIIKRGIATGANKYFILTEKDVEANNLEKKFLKSILPGPRYLDSEIIERDSNGEPKISKKMYVLDCDSPEEIIKKKYPNTWEYLKRPETESIKSRTLIRKRSPWFSQEKREPPLYFCTYFGRNKKNTRPIRFLFNKSNAIATNSYTLIYPNVRLKKILDNHPEVAELIFIKLQEIPRSILASRGRVYGGGLYKLEPKELGSLPADDIMNVIRKYSIDAL